MKIEPKKIGTEFERKVFEFLKLKFDDVKWLSKENGSSTYDFEVESNHQKFFVEAKYSLIMKKPTLRKSQLNADFVAINDGDEIELIPNKKFEAFLRLQKEEITMIEIDKDVHKEFMLFKIQSNAKNIRDVLRLAIQKLKEEEIKNDKLDKKPV